MQKFSKIFIDFTVKMMGNLEGFKYKEKPVGLGAILINFIGSNPNCTMSDIISYLNVIPSTATRRVDKLVDLGFVDRGVSLSDRRVVSLKLTQEGDEMFTHYMQKRFKRLYHLQEKFTKDELDNFISVLNYLLDESDDFMDKYEKD